MGSSVPLRSLDTPSSDPAPSASQPKLKRASCFGWFFCGSNAMSSPPPRPNGTDSTHSTQRQMAQMLTRLEHQTTEMQRLRDLLEKQVPGPPPMPDPVPSAPAMPCDYDPTGGHQGEPSLSLSEQKTDQIEGRGTETRPPSRLLGTNVGPRTRGAQP